MTKSGAKDGLQGGRQFKTGHSDRRLPDLVTVEVLASRWNLKPGTIRKWARLGQIPSRRMGRLLVFDVRELDDWYRQLPSGAKAAPGNAQASVNPID